MPQTILVLMDHVETAASVLQTALLLQQRLQAGALQLLHISHDPHEGFMPTEDVMTAQRWQALRDQAIAKAEAVKSLVDAAHLSPDRAVWHERTGDTATVLRTDCAMADIIVTGRTTCGTDLHVLNTLLFGVQRATLIAPPAVPASLGKHIVVAWKDSPAAHTVVRLAMPLLQRTEQVTVLIGDEAAGSLDEEPAALVQAMVAANVPVAVHRFTLGDRGIGDALLEEAHRLGGDLLVMGAYTHSRLREAVLGGATRDILANAAMPVLLAH